MEKAPVPDGKATRPVLEHDAVVELAGWGEALDLTEGVVIVRRQLVFADGAAQLRPCLAATALLMQHQPQQVVHVGVSRSAPRDVAVHGLCLLQFAGAMPRHRGIHEPMQVRLQGRWAASRCAGFACGLATPGGQIRRVVR